MLSQGCGTARWSSVCPECQQQDLTLVGCPIMMHSRHFCIKGPICFKQPPEGSRSSAHAKVIRLCCYPCLARARLESLHHIAPISQTTNKKPFRVWGVLLGPDNALKHSNQHYLLHAVQQLLLTFCAVDGLC